MLVPPQASSVVIPSEKTVPQAAAARDKTLSLASVLESIENGDAIIILGRNVLKLNSWLDHHPGGDKAILHLVGRDATDEVNSFHSIESRKSMRKYQIGVLEGTWVNVTPPIQRATPEKKILELETVLDCCDMIVADQSSSTALGSSKATARCRFGQTSCRCCVPGNMSSSAHLPLAQPLEESPMTQDEVVASFRNLISQMKAEGMYVCKSSAYLPDVFRICVLFCIMLFFLRSGWFLTSAVFMGAFWHQLVFVAHDAGHMGVTGEYHLDTLIGMTIGNYLGGLSMGWWKHSHNVHHLVTNSPSHDPDISHLPFMAITPSFFTSIYSTAFERIMPYDPFAQLMTQYQAYTYYPLLCLGRFNLYLLSLEFLIKDLGPRTNRWHRYYELLGQFSFWAWFGYGIIYSSIPDWTTRALFLLISHAITMPLHVQFTLSHFAMSTEPRGLHEPWVLQQLRTTMDVACPSWMDWFHGGLQYQTIHHLFPRMPKHNLRAASERVKIWSKDVGARYEIYGFVECNGKVIGRLEEVGRLARTMYACQQKIVEKGDFLRGEWD